MEKPFNFSIPTMEIDSISKIGVAYLSINNENNIDDFTKILNRNKICFYDDKEKKIKKPIILDNGLKKYEKHKNIFLSGLVTKGEIKLFDFYQKNGFLSKEIIKNIDFSQSYFDDKTNNITYHEGEYEIVKKEDLNITINEYDEITPLNFLNDWQSQVGKNYLKQVVNLWNSYTKTYYTQFFFQVFYYDSNESILKNLGQDNDIIEIIKFFSKEMFLNPPCSKNILKNNNKELIKLNKDNGNKKYPIGFNKYYPITIEEFNNLNEFNKNKIISLSRSFINGNNFIKNYLTFYLKGIEIKFVPLLCFIDVSKYNDFINYFISNKNISLDKKENSEDGYFNIFAHFESLFHNGDSLLKPIFDRIPFDIYLKVNDISYLIEGVTPNQIINIFEKYGKIFGKNEVINSLSLLTSRNNILTGYLERNTSGFKSSNKNDIENINLLNKILHEKDFSQELKNIQKFDIDLLLKIVNNKNDINLYRNFINYKKFLIIDKLLNKNIIINYFDETNFKKISNNIIDIIPFIEKKLQTSNSFLEKFMSKISSNDYKNIKKFLFDELKYIKIDENLGLKGNELLVNMYLSKINSNKDILLITFKIFEVISGKINIILNDNSFKNENHIKFINNNGIISGNVLGVINSMKNISDLENFILFILNLISKLYFNYNLHSNIFKLIGLVISNFDINYLKWYILNSFLNINLEKTKQKQK